VPLDLTDIQTVLRTFRQPAASPPKSVRARSVITHEILGGTADPDNTMAGAGLSVTAAGYFKAWAVGGNLRASPNAPKSGPAGTVVAPAPEVKVVDHAGNPVVNFPVRFKITEGDGVLNTSDKTFIVLTNKTGVASVPWTFGPNPGVNEVIAEGYQLSFMFTVTST
jgi:hypothetical protein